MRNDQIALQLYTVREHTAHDMPITLRRVASIGYTAVEFAGYGGLSPRDLSVVLKDLGLRAAGAHVPFESWEANPGAVIADMHALDCVHAVVPMAPPERRSDMESISRLAEDFDRWGRLCRQEGITFSYHNHDFEFVRLDETTMWDILVRETDPKLVRFELDLYWVKYAGMNPNSLLQELANRVSLVHLKDMASNEERSDVPVGEGTMPWRQLLQTADIVGAEWFIVEQDHPRDALKDVQTSLQNLRSL